MRYTFYMKILRPSNYILLVIIVSVIFSFSISTEKVLATVGGPTYISSIAFNAQENSVYYTVHENGGRGCPPIIHEINLTTLKDLEVKSCTRVEQEFLSGEYEEGIKKYSQFVAGTYQNLPYLGSVSLEKNNISIDVEFLSEHIEDGYTLWSEFSAVVIQGNEEISKINFRGCAKDQPHIFEGYRIPNSDTMAILISNKGDCFEGGYVNEGLYVVKGIKYYDTDIVRSIKEQSATEPNQGNTVVYAVLDGTGNNASDNDNDDASVPQKNSVANIALTAAAFGVGAILGYVLGKKSSRSIGNNLSSSNGSPK